MTRQNLETELEITLNNLNDIKSNKLKAQSIVWTLENLGLLLTNVNPNENRIYAEAISQRRDN